MLDLYAYTTLSLGAGTNPVTSSVDINFGGVNVLVMTQLSKLGALVGGGGAAEVYIKSYTDNTGASYAFDTPGGAPSILSDNLSYMTVELYAANVFAEATVAIFKIS